MMARRILTCAPAFLRNLRFCEPHARLRCASSKSDDKRVNVTFLMPDGEKIKSYGRVGDSILDVVIERDIPVDGYGACEGTLACSTCHIVLSQSAFDAMPEQPTDEELDMLDLAHGLTDTSRLGCQIVLSKDLEGLEVKVPESIHDARLEESSESDRSN